MMNDLNKFTTVPGKKRFRAISLADNVPLITALPMTWSLRMSLLTVAQPRRPGDALIAISGSGNSPNIIRAVEYALR